MVGAKPCLAEALMMATNSVACQRLHGEACPPCSGLLPKKPLSCNSSRSNKTNLQPANRVLSMLRITLLHIRFVVISVHLRFSHIFLDLRPPRPCSRCRFNISPPMTVSHSPHQTLHDHTQLFSMRRRSTLSNHIHRFSSILLQLPLPLRQLSRWQICSAHLQ